MRRGRRGDRPARTCCAAGLPLSKASTTVVAPSRAGRAGGVRELGIGFVAPFSPLGKGFLTGTCLTPRPPSPITICGRRFLGSPARRWNTTSHWSRRPRPSQPPGAPPPGKLRSAGCSPSSRRSCPSPAPPSYDSRNNLAAADLTLTEAELSQLNNLSSRIEIHAPLSRSARSADQSLTYARARGRRGPGRSEDTRSPAERSAAVDQPQPHSAFVGSSS